MDFVSHDVRKPLVLVLRKNGYVLVFPAAQRPHDARTRGVEAFVGRGSILVAAEVTRLIILKAVRASSRRLLRASSPSFTRITTSDSQRRRGRFT
jgi:hypothetical protein